MALKDYEHWNEEALSMWWAEEGRFDGSEEERDYDPDDFMPEDDWCKKHQQYDCGEDH